MPWVDRTLWEQTEEFADRICKARDLGWSIDYYQFSPKGDELFTVTSPDGRYMGTVNAPPFGDYNDSMIRLDECGVPE